ncbi:hypothetical protein PVAG01_06508 [Phlyctema vagabunda]|uniref:Caspase domain-containing protein n=1 Tax=Phlyctema vagabunda TaxID=108571 RepID=A0ABR4PG89_9HELO
MAMKAVAMEGHFPHISDDSSSSRTSKSRTSSFASIFNTKLQTTFQSRRTRYDFVTVLFTSWEEDHRLDHDIEILKKYFTDVLGFQTEWFKIPHTSPEDALGLKLKEKEYCIDCGSNLFILYYGGGAQLDSKKSPIWQPYGSTSPIIKWSPMQYVLERSASDVLLILDCSYGVASSRNRDGDGYSAFVQHKSVDEPLSSGKTEIIAAPQQDSVSLAKGNISFTQAITQAFRNLHDKPLTVNQLHVNLVGMAGLSSSPVYLRLSNANNSSIRFPRPYGSDLNRAVQLDVVLRRKLNYLDMEPLLKWMEQAPSPVQAPQLSKPNLSHLPYDGDTFQSSLANPETLNITIPLEGAFMPDQAEWKDWLGFKAPSFVERVDVRPQPISLPKALGLLSNHDDPLELLAEQLNINTAISEGMESRKYDKVTVLPLLWEDGLRDLVDEMEDLRLSFSEYFDDYNVEPIWEIPLDQPDLALYTKIIEICTVHNKQNELVIIAYGGHGVNTIQGTGTSVWAQTHLPGGPTVEWTGIQKLLETSNCDVAIILNCCYAATAALSPRKGTNYLLAACDPQSETYRGPYSYMKVVNKMLVELAKQEKPFSLPRLGEYIKEEALRHVKDMPMPYHSHLKELHDRTSEIFLQPSRKNASSSEVKTSTVPEPGYLYAKFKISQPACVSAKQWEQWLTDAKLPEHTQEVHFFTSETLYAELKANRSK